MRNLEDDRLGKLPDLVLSSEALNLLMRHAELVREWNRVVSLVSKKDAEELVSRHIIDSLSLMPAVSAICGDEGLLLDIGSGGGYPAIPLKIVLPGTRMVLVERSVRKVGFLRKVVGALDLSGVEIRHGEFPGVVEDVTPAVITGRAVEKPKRVLVNVLKFVERGAVFLCQSGDPGDHVRDKFHVEQWEDEWSAQGLRRGGLHIIRRR